MSDTASATLPAGMLAPVSGSTSDFNTIKSGMQAASKDAQAAGKEKDTAIKAERDELQGERQALRDFEQQHPFPHPDIKPWTEKPPENNPMQRFGSWASVVGILAGALTKTPLTSSLNASAAAMNAFRKNDMDAYEEAKTAWKENTDIAIKNAEWETKGYQNAFELMKTDQALGQAAAQTIAATAENHAAMAAIKSGDLKTLWSITEGMQRLAGEGQERSQRMEEFATKMEDTRDRAKLLAQALVDDAKKPPAEQMTPEQKAQLRTRIMNPQYTINQAKGLVDNQGGSALTSGDKSSMGAQAASGQPLTQIVPGLSSKVAATRNEVRREAIDQIKSETGMDDKDAGVELARREVNYTFGVRSSNQLNTMLGATRQAVSQLDYNISQVKKELKNITSSDLSPIVNAIARGEEKWTGDPTYAQLFYSMNAVATESARILAGGQASVAQLHEGARAEAEKWAGINMTPESFNAVAETMHDEGDARIKTFEDALQAQTPLAGKGKPSAGGTKTDFPDEAAARAAEKAGDIKVGDKITIGGKKFTVQD